MIEVTSRHMECTYFDLDYSRMPVVALHVQGRKRRKMPIGLKVLK